MMPENTISRRTLLTLVAAGGAGALLGCNPGTTPATGSAAFPDPLLVEAGDGLAVLRDGWLHQLPRAVASPDGRVIYATEQASGTTALWRLDVASGSGSEPVSLRGRWAPRAVSTDGTRVALTSGESTEIYHRPAGRKLTPMLIADAAGARHQFDLPGNYVPETFTLDLESLFLLDWLPAMAPDQYRVRVVDLATQQVGPLLTRQKTPVPPDAEEQMRGDGRQAIASPDGSVLYTLYTHQPDHVHTGTLLGARPGSDVHAFIHTLQLRERWAVCIDLPRPFGEGPVEGHTMALGMRGTRLYVADLSSGNLAEIDTEALTVSRTSAIPSQQGSAHSALHGNDLVLAADRAVYAVDVAQDAVIAEWTAPEAVRGLAVGGDGRHVYLGMREAISMRTMADGAEQGRMAVPGLTRLRGLAPS